MSEGPAPGRAFSPVTVALMIAVGVFAFAAFAVLSAYAPELRRGNDGGAHALSKSAVGYAAAVKLLEGVGEPVEIRRGAQVRPGASLLVLTPTPQTDPAAIRSLIRRSGSPVLVVAPKWLAEPDPRRPGWVRREGLAEQSALSRRMARWTELENARLLPRITDARSVQLNSTVPGDPVRAGGRIEHLQLLARAPGIRSAFHVESGVVLANVEGRSGSVFVLSDPDFLNTQGLAERDTAGAALAMLGDLRAGGGPVVFDVSLHGFGGGRSLLKLAFAPPFLAVTLCAAAAAALAGWQAAVRFGPGARAARAFAPGKQALADNAAALIKLGGREPRMARRYAELVQARAAQAVAAPPGDDAATAGYLDGLPRAAADSPRLSELRARARAAGSREQMLAAARALHRWRREITREQ